MPGALVMWSQQNFQGQVIAVEEPAISTSCTQVALSTGARSSTNLTTNKTVALYETLSDCTNDQARLATLAPAQNSPDFGKQAFYYKQV